jgi:hypothetical protein
MGASGGQVNFQHSRRLTATLIALSAACAAASAAANEPDDVTYHGRTRGGADIGLRYLEQAGTEAWGSGEKGLHAYCVWTDGTSAPDRLACGPTLAAARSHPNVVYCSPDPSDRACKVRSPAIERLAKEYAKDWSYSGYLVCFTGCARRDAAVILAVYTAE